ncbi:TPA: hypothetical protein ACH3X1_003312 [Trebouxia sp. C0004]
MEAVRGLLQPIEDKYVLNIETLQAPKPCSFLLYVTYSSSHRLVNFDNDAFERFKQSCSTENAVILVIHRGQNDPENEEKIMSISPASGFASGLHLGTQATKLHLLQLLAYGRYGETPQLLSDSESNKQNQQLLFNLLQEILQADECALVKQQPAADQCRFIQEHCVSESLVNYVRLYYCHVKPAGYLVTCLLQVACVFILLLLFRVLGSTAENFFSPILTQLSQELGLPPRLAGGMHTRSHKAS